MASAEMIELTLAHSPDPDDAFMWWPLGDLARDAPPVIDTEGFAFRAEPSDIEALNQRAIERGDLDITAISVHTYPHVKDRYALTSCGASMGEGYGPKVVCRADDGPDSDDDGESARKWLASGARIAVPGTRTTAFLTLSMLIDEPFEAVAMPFERIIDAVAQGEVDAGVVIHEGQLTYQDSGLRLLADLGAWWHGRTSLPLPLGANVVRRGLETEHGAGALARLTRVLKRSIEHALRERGVGVDYALGFARGLDPALADRFIAMYVNERTVDVGAEGEDAIRRLLRFGAERGLCPDPGEVDVIWPEGAAAKS